MTNSNHIVEFSIQTTPAQILSQVIPHVQKHGIEVFELARISDQLKMLTEGACDGRAVINCLAAYDIRLYLVGKRLMPFAFGEQPSIIIPSLFSDTTMQFHSYLEPVRRESRPSFYFPTLDAESGTHEMLVKQGVWLKNYNGNYTYALLQKFRADKQMLVDAGDFSGRTTIWLPVVRLDTEGPRKMTLLHCRASTLKDLESPFSCLYSKTSSSFSVLEPVAMSQETLGELREVVTEASVWYSAILEFFDPANNPIDAEVSRTVRELLIASETAKPEIVRAMLTVPNRNLQ